MSIENLQEPTDPSRVNYSDINVARGDGSRGMLVVDSARIEIVNHHAVLQVGRGDLNEQGAGGVGTATIENGGSVLVKSNFAGGGASVRVGRDGGTGTLNADASTLTIESLSFGISRRVSPAAAPASAAAATER